MYKKNENKIVLCELLFPINPDVAPTIVPSNESGWLFDRLMSNNNYVQGCAGCKYYDDETPSCKLQAMRRVAR